MATFFRGVDGIALPHQTYPGRDFEGGGGCRRGGHRHERVECLRIPVPAVTALDLIYPDRQMRVLGEPQGLQATILDHLTEATWCRGVGNIAIPIFMPSTPSNSSLAASNRARLKLSAP